MRTNSDINENDIMDMIVNNNNEYNQNCSSRTLINTKIKKNKFFNNGKPINLDEDDEFLFYYRKRSNSVDLYKKKNKEKQLKKQKEIHNNNEANEIKNNNENNNINTNTKINNDKSPENLDDNININKINEKKNNNINVINGKKIKKVSFLMPKFVTIIDVESYKQFNAENTCKDPFEDLIKNNNSKGNNVTSSNKDKQLNDKERVVCSCFII